MKALNAMLQTEIHQYKDANGKAYFSPSREPVFPKGLPIQAIHGLNNVTQRRHYAQQLMAEPKAPKTGSGHSGGYAPSDIRTAYNIPTSVNGSGQVWGSFELDGFNQSDISAYEAYYNLPNATVTPVSVDGTSTSSPGGGIGEVTLDIELQLAVAPVLRFLFMKDRTATRNARYSMRRSRAITRLSRSALPGVRRKPEPPAASSKREYDLHADGRSRSVDFLGGR